MGFFKGVGNFFKSVGGKAAAAAANPAMALGAVTSLTDLIAANQDRQAQKGIANQQHLDTLLNMQQQKEFAQHGIRWKVQDAIAAGLHPLAAVGAQGASFSPVASVGTGDPGSGESFRAVGRMGQNITRAIQATRTPEEREAAALNIESLRLRNQGDFINNQILAEQLKKLVHGVGPPQPKLVPRPPYAGVAFDAMTEPFDAIASWLRGNNINLNQGHLWPATKNFFRRQRDVIKGFGSMRYNRGYRRSEEIK